MYFSEDIISEIISKNDIVNVISEYVSLKRSGSNYMCLCPFHSEKTPSFSVSASKQFFNCFGCGEGGNVISFIQKIEKLTFIEALKLLAERAGVEVKDYKNHKELERLNEKNEIIRMNTETARYFYSRLIKSRKPLEYLKSRGIDESILKSFGLGYALDSWDALIKYLISKNFSIESIYKAGLALPKKQRNGYYDRFRNRIIFPIIDLQGKVIAFGGRVMDDSKPKYLNSPETPVFFKGNNIYGLNIVKRIPQLDSIIVVEGYMDVLALHQYGINNAVASLGTAFTENQAKILKRFSNNIIISYDSDLAGQTATLRGLAVLEKQGCKVKVLQMPSGKDPDDYVRKNGVESFRVLIDNSLSLVQYKIENSKSNLNLNNFDERITFTKRFANILREIDSKLEVDAYIKKYSKELRINEEAIYSELNRLSNRYKNGNNKHNIKSDNKIIRKKQTADVKAEIYLLNICIDNLDKAKDVFKQISPQNFVVELHKNIAENFVSNLKKEKIPTIGDLMSYFDEDSTKKEIAEIFSIKLPDMDYIMLIKSCLESINKTKINLRIQELNIKMNELLQKNDKENANAVFNKIKELQKRVK